MSFTCSYVLNEKTINKFFFFKIATYHIVFLAAVAEMARSKRKGVRKPFRCPLKKCREKFATKPGRAHHVKEEVIYQTFSRYRISGILKLRSNSEVEFPKPNSTIRVLIATVAFGIGVDIPDVTLVIHWGAAREQVGQVVTGAKPAP